MTARRHLPSELVIGVVGPYDLVERIMLSGAAARDEALSPGQPEPSAFRPDTAESPTGAAPPGLPAWSQDDPRALAGGTLPRRLIAAAYRRGRGGAGKGGRVGGRPGGCVVARPGAGG